MKGALISLCGAIGFALFIGSGCQTDAPQVGSQTNWLKACDAGDDCGDLVCLCGTCTLSCDGGNDCEALGSDSCVFAEETGASAVCNGTPPTAGMCLPRCEDEPCPEGTSCVAGVCLASPIATISLVVDPAEKYQTLIGLGASIAYSEDYIVAHDQKEALLDAMFAESGLDAIRIRNRYEPGNEPALDTSSEIIAAAEQRLGTAPVVFLTTGSPPAALKINGNRFCVNSDVNCTLVRDVDGGFDYAAYAEYWRASLEAYAAIGVVPDFVSIQNHPNFVPPDEGAIEACRFLPVEGTTTVTLPDGSTTDAEFPGYQEALAAVLAAVGTLPDAYEFSGPEAGTVTSLSEFGEVLGDTTSISYHLYGVSPDDESIDSLAGIRMLGEETGKPIIQSEMWAGSLDTARLVHHAFVDSGASAYFHQGFAGPTEDLDNPVLIGGNETTFRKHDTYFSLSHFALATDPGWVRVGVEAESEGVLASAYVSPDDDALTVVLVNAGDEVSDVEVALAGDLDLLNGAHVFRTVFSGVERYFDLGPLPSDGVVRLPAGSIVTIAPPAE